MHPDPFCDVYSFGCPEPHCRLLIWVIAIVVTDYMMIYTRGAIRIGPSTALQRTWAFGLALLGLPLPSHTGSSLTSRGQQTRGFAFLPQPTPEADGGE
jgi:hypothetical protein